MGTIYLVIIFIHAGIHLMGFLKSMGTVDFETIENDIPPFIGWLWLITAALFCVYAYAWYHHTEWEWQIGVASVVLSQLLIFRNWTDAKFGTIPNVIIGISIWEIYTASRIEDLFMLS